MKISIAIPCFEMSGIGAGCLEFSFQRILEQTFKDFEVVISDSSNDNKIQILCEKWQDKFDLKYIKSAECAGSPTLNSTKAIKSCNGEWIKFICLDDFLMYPNSLQKIVNALDDNYNWMVTAYIHTYDRINFEKYHLPQLNPNICVVNTIGSPSCMILKNLKDLPEFDSQLFYAYDCDFYHRMIQQFGNPKILTDVTVGTLLGKHSLTSELATQEFINKENEYILKKYGLDK
jgi:glycosyltransferase involved in cell wall biosynthesis